MKTKSYFPLPRLLSLFLILSVLVIVAGAWLIWEGNHEIYGHNDGKYDSIKELNFDMAHAFSEQLPGHFLIYKITGAVQLFEAEFLLLALDTDRSDTRFRSVYEEIKRLRNSLDLLSTKALPDYVPRLELHEDLGVLLDIAEELFDDFSVNNRIQLLQDVTDSMRRIRDLSRRLEKALNQDIESLSGRIRTRIKLEADNVDYMQDLFTRFNIRLLIIFSLILALVPAFQIAISHVLQKRLQNLSTYAGNIAQGDFSAPLPFKVKDNTGELALSLKSMAENLAGLIEKSEQAKREAEQARFETEEQNWQKDGQNQLNEVLRGEQNLNELTEKALVFLCKYLHADRGLFYLLLNDGKKQEKSLKLFASHAFEKRAALANHVVIGEGLAGQAAMESCMILLSKAEEGDSVLATPAALGLPLFYGNDLKGVIELGFSADPPTAYLELLAHISQDICVAINSAEYRDRLRQHSSMNS